MHLDFCAVLSRIDKMTYHSTTIFPITKVLMEGTEASRLDPLYYMSHLRQYDGIFNTFSCETYRHRQGIACIDALCGGKVNAYRE